MRQRRKRGRVYGPYEEPGGWRVVVINAKGERTSATFAREREAVAERLAAERELETEVITVSQALVKYEEYQVAKGNKPRSIATTKERLRSLLRDQEECLVDLTPARCQRLYDDLAARVAVDTHRNTLNQARTFFRWAEKRGFVRANPLASVDGIGRRRRGKPQLRIDEARAFVSVAAAMARAGDRGALGALMALLMGMRASEILRLEARDVDDAGRVIWIDDAKTEAGRRTLYVPPELTDLLKAAAAEGGQLLPTQEHQWLNRQVRHLCGLAGVPRVCTHGLRGTHATLGTEFGSSSLVVSQALGHASEDITRAHYTLPEASAAAVQRRVTLRLKE
jgi:integrase